MKIDSNDFRVRDRDEVDLRDWPTMVDRVYKSKEHYQKLLAEHVAQLSSRTRRTTTTRSGTAGIARSRIWRGTCATAEPASSSSTPTSRKKSSESAFSNASMGRKKNWKFSLVDIEERKFWKRYIKAYETSAERRQELLSIRERLAK